MPTTTGRESAADEAVGRINPDDTSEIDGPLVIVGLEVVKFTLAIA